MMLIASVMVPPLLEKTRMELELWERITILGVLTVVTALLIWAVFRKGKAPRECTCAPCESPAYGAPGRDHCAACCYGSMIEDYDHDCPVAEHREMAQLQWPLERMIDG